MKTADNVVARAATEQRSDNLPVRVREIIDRHRQTLLDLANALLAAGHNEDEVVQVIQKASESFSIKLNSQTEGLQS